MEAPRLTDYQTAGEFFKAVYNASRECERTRRTIEAMRAREGMRAQRYDSQGTSGHSADAMRQTDRRLDFERRMDERVRWDLCLMELATDVIYGRSAGKGGVCLLAGSAVADVMCFRFVEGAMWHEVAGLSGYSERQCQRLCEVGIETCDSYGWHRVADGIGIAEN